MLKKFARQECTVRHSTIQVYKGISPDIKITRFIVEKTHHHFQYNSELGVNYADIYLLLMIK